MRAAEPVLIGALVADAEALAEHTALGENLLAELPPRPDRGPDQQQAAERIHLSCRRLRAGFAHLHAIRIYDELTAGRTRYVRLPELVYDAAERYPGLVPTRLQMAAEREHLQGDKEGREIDQGLFFRALLRVPELGAHLLDAMLRPTDQALELLPGFQRDGVVDLGAVHVERRHGAARLTVRNLRALNAEDEALIGQMETAVDLALLDDQVRVGVLRGGVMTHPRYLGRRVFSAGINLTELYEGRIPLVEFLLGREVGYISKLVRGLLMQDDGGAWPRRTVDKPWLAAVDTFAIGGGMQLLLAVDRVIACSDSYLSLPAAQEGIIPGAGTFRLPRRAGGQLTRQIILDGRKLWASESDARCLIDEVVDPADMDAAVEAGVAHLGSPAVAGNRRMLNLTEESPDRFREYMAEFAVEQALRMYGRDVIDKVERRVAARSRHPRLGRRTGPTTITRSTG